jgi:HPt (histidine-containing phosphotransfer) domain-containing protein
MDHMMPKMDGIEAVKNIRDLGYKEPVIALTANAVAGQAEMFLTNGFDDFISKPVDMRLLNSALNKYIRDKQTPEVIKATYREEEASKAQAGDTFRPDTAEEEQIMEIGMPFTMPGLDTERGLALFDGDTESYILALRSFITNMPEMIDKLRQVTEENLPDYAGNVHGLKSISGWIGAEDIRAKAANLEALAKAGDFSAVLALNAGLLKDTEAFITGLRARLEKLDAIE